MDKLDDFDSFADALEIGDLILSAKDKAQFADFWGYLESVGYALKIYDRFTGTFDFRCPTNYGFSQVLVVIEP